MARTGATKSSSILLLQRRRNLWVAAVGGVKKYYRLPFVKGETEGFYPSVILERSEGYQGGDE
jgi:hypothetical protein